MKNKTTMQLNIEVPIELGEKLRNLSFYYRVSKAELARRALMAFVMSMEVPDVIPL
jgi:hypothetical protein